MEITDLKITNVRKGSTGDFDNDVVFSVTVEIEFPQGGHSLLGQTYTNEISIDVRAETDDITMAPEEARQVLLKWAEDLAARLREPNSLR